MPGNPDMCECGSQLFTAVWAVTAQDDISDNELDPKKGNTEKRIVGFKCIECDSIQLTRKIPQRHADHNNLNMPDAADRDMIRE